MREFRQNANYNTIQKDSISPTEEIEEGKGGCDGNIKKQPPCKIGGLFYF